MSGRGKCGILTTATWRRSILVGPAVSEEGPKNPLKGITVKPLVPASYAQFGVGAERKARNSVRLRIQGVFQWHGKADPAFVETCSCAQAHSLCGNRPVYGSGLNPYRGATRSLYRERCVRSSLPCVGMADRRFTQFFPGQGHSAIAP